MSLDQISHRDVMANLSKSLLFLSFGHPEGFGLPVAEAMASGCAVVGYSGLGGRELFAIGSEYNMVSQVEYGDINGFISSVSDFCESYRQFPDTVSNKLKSMASDISSRYSMKSMQNSVNSFLESFEFG